MLRVRILYWFWGFWNWSSDLIKDANDYMFSGKESTDSSRTYAKQFH